MIDSNESLRARVQRTEAPEAWTLLFERYWAVIFTYAHHSRLAGRQAEEVLQETMVTLMRLARAEDGGLGWDRLVPRIVHERCLVAQRRARREFETVAPWAAATDASARATAAEEGDATVRWHRSLLEVALMRLAREGRVEPRTEAVYRSYVILGRPASAVAAEFGLKENAVYQIKNRVSRHLQSRLAHGLGRGEPATA